ncbi:hypothetical protein GGX14DRAFT_595902 [Mycena pura]|uniref:Uncharacterized protein n=1 Tax=Mycena pura TaxID=153505 RepID=A0AAD6UQL5_9AGAR|nr:hypothetical protein GGX14DRAFT_595902 [Mycena pura]
MSGEGPLATAALLSIRLCLLAIHHWEHRFTFLIEHQTTVSFWAAVVSQSFGTIYCAVLVFLTQKLAMQRTTELMTLTAVHDSISALAGLGSALATLSNQASVPASVLGTLSIVGYSGCISALHVSIPAILFVNAFNATASVAIPASTSGMPEYANSSMIKGVLGDSQMLGLSNGSLYEVLDVTTPGNDKAQVSAIGFNITCGYLSAKIHSVDVTNKRIVLLVDGDLTEMIDLVPNTVYPLDSTNNSLTMLSTIAISDSEGHPGSPILLDQQSPSVLQNLTRLNLYISQLELLQCSKSLVAQTGLISARSNTIINGSLYPDTHKTQSNWISSLQLDFSPQDSSLLGDDLWSAMLFDSVLFDNNTIEEYLMSYLGTDPFANTSAPVLQLHNIENALSNLVAMLFWTGGHITVDQWDVLLPGSLQSTRIITDQVKFELECFIQMSLCIKFPRTPTKPEGSRSQGVGLLANIWWWRNQRISSTPITDVHQPTESNLRTAGLIPLQQYTNQAGHNDAGSKENELASSFTIKTSTVCMLMHVLLVMIHIIALVFAVQRKEHSIIFSLDKQQAVSSICKIATTAFGTIFYAMLIYLTQRLATTNTMHKYSPLTAIHDKGLAWTGIGSTVSTLYEQIKSPGPCLEILIIFLYLATISGLHVTTSALVSVESFNLSVSTKVQTRSIPEWSDTVDNSTLKYIAGNGAILPWINGLDDSKKLGLSNGSLYDVLEQDYPGSATTEVSALGFNITCGYIPDIAVQIINWIVEEGQYLINVSSPRFNLRQFNMPGANYLLIASISDPDTSGTLPADSIVLCTQISVYDSNDALGSPVTVPHDNRTFQFLECSNTPTRQIGRVNASTRLLDPTSLYPTIQKHSSAWRAYQNVSNPGVLDQTSMLGGGYKLKKHLCWVIYCYALQGDMLYENRGGIIVTILFSRIEVLFLFSNLVASTFWAGGNVHLSPLAVQSQFGSVTLPNVAAGNATVQQVVSAARLNLTFVNILLALNTCINFMFIQIKISLPAVSIGLAGSILLLVLIGWISIGTNNSNPPLARLGLLQIIWIFEHHPELHEILEQVDDPTDDNLRSAGMVNVCLADAFVSEERDW